MSASRTAAVTRAAAVLLDADTLELVGSSLARIPTNMPYVPGLLSFRELPVLQALAELPAIPDLIFPTATASPTRGAWASLRIWAW